MAEQPDGRRITPAGLTRLVTGALNKHLASLAKVCDASLNGYR